MKERIKMYALLHGEARMTESELKDFQKGDTIWGIDSNPETIEKYSREALAYEALRRYRCAYNLWPDGSGDADEYAVETYWETDDGDYAEGDGFELADEKRIYFTLRRETGALIEAHQSYYDAKQAIVEYESEDKRQGIFEEDCYEIVDRSHCTIQTKLAIERKRAKMTAENLAKESGVNFQMIRKYESGAKDINKAAVSTVAALARALKCDIEDIID